MVSPRNFDESPIDVGKRKKEREREKGKEIEKENNKETASSKFDPRTNIEADIP